jgi:hypothetical protein
MAIPTGVEPVTFSSGGRGAHFDISAENHEETGSDSALFSPESLSISVEKTLMILMAVERACYAYATGSGSSAQTKPSLDQSKRRRKGGSHS